ncbi:hypothetical protein KUTeg_001449 [Tegillarca granosa]|uniref:Sfi1 spindle body domain-containing protein n=1 Tax=Tegillarca granosa TaxID=220873 RepID=A0ABQ9FT39_TEGGR|nr:hypothetical protein KUTeg_001449 [Tegillarca granosa]
MNSKYEIVFLVIKRIRFYPLSTIFDQWKEYTAQQRQFKQLSAQVISLCNQMETKMEMLMKRKTFKLLFDYKCERQWKKKLSTLASHHHALMAQDKRQKEKIVHLWTNVTSEEQSLIPKEEVIVQRLCKRNTKKYFAVWYFKFQQIHKLRTAYNNILLQKVVSAWKTWAHNKAEQKWMLSLVLSFLEWMLSLVLSFLSSFISVQYSIEKLMTINQTYETEIIEAWHSITVYKKQLRRKVLDFQVKSYTKHYLFCFLHISNKIAIYEKNLKATIFFNGIFVLQTIRMFNIWHQHYLEKLKEHEEHSKLLERNALKIGRKWRKIAQKSRSNRLQQVFTERKIILVGKCNNAFENGNVDMKGTWKEKINFKDIFYATAEKLSVDTNLTATKDNEILLCILAQHNCCTTVNTETLQLKTEDQMTMTKRINLNILQNTWYTMRGQFDYFHSLTELAEKLVSSTCKCQLVSQEKNQICLRKALSVWRERLNRVIASHCYQHLLALRAIRKWRRFERETEMKKAWKKWRLEFIKRKTAKTISDYNEKMLLSQVFHAWKSFYLKKPAQRRVSSIPVLVQSSQTQNIREQSAIPVLIQTSQQQREQTQIPAPSYNTRTNSALTRKHSFSKKY